MRVIEHEKVHASISLFPTQTLLIICSQFSCEPLFMNEFCFKHDEHNAKILIKRKFQYQIGHNTWWMAQN